MVWAIGYMSPNTGQWERYPETKPFPVDLPMGPMEIPLSAKDMTNPYPQASFHNKHAPDNLRQQLRTHNWWLVYPA